MECSKLNHFPEMFQVHWNLGIPIGGVEALLHQWRIPKFQCQTYDK